MAPLPEARAIWVARYVARHVTHKTRRSAAMRQVREAMVTRERVTVSCPYTRAQVQDTYTLSFYEHVQQYSQGLYDSLRAELCWFSDLFKASERWICTGGEPAIIGLLADEHRRVLAARLLTKLIPMGTHDNKNTIKPKGRLRWRSQRAYVRSPEKAAAISR